MTAKELAERLRHMMEQFPECADRDIKILTKHGRIEVDEVVISVTSNVWLIEK